MTHANLELGDLKLLKKPVRGLQTKLIILTILFVMIAEVLAFVPSVANTRVRWIKDRLNTAAAASIVIDGQEGADLSSSVQMDALMATGTKAIILRKEGTSRMIASVDMPPSIDQQYDLDALGPVQAIVDAFDTLIFGGDRFIRVLGKVGDSQDIQIELIMEDYQLRHAMLIYSRNVLLISLIIAFITSGLLFFSLNKLMIGPIRRLTNSMQNFSENPEDAARIIEPGKGNDELWLAEQHLSSMQTQLHATLKQQKRLAELGLAVSKINHDMRNILTSAQLISDRMADVDDPMVKRFAPKLLQTIDRAVGYSSEVLSYGKAREREPKRQLLSLWALTEELRDSLSQSLEDNQIDFINQVPEGLELEADNEQLMRVMTNLARNAIEALGVDRETGSAIIKRLVFSAEVQKDNRIAVFIDDTGPGMPEKAKEHLFKPFRGSARAGGTGLGLAIVKELVEAHGGDIQLKDKPSPGTRFQITLPQYSQIHLSG